MVRFVYKPCSKILSRPDETYHLWGVAFPAGVPVEVTDERLAHKCRCLSQLHEVAVDQANATTQTAPVPSVPEPPLSVEGRFLEVPLETPLVLTESQPVPVKRGRGRPRKVQP